MPQPARPPPAGISFLPQIVNLDLYAGDGVAVRIVSTYPPVLPPPDPEDPLAPVEPIIDPYPLTGEVAAQIRMQRTDEFPMAQWTVNMDDAEDGIVTLHLDGAQTSALVIDGGPAVRATRINGQWVLRFLGAWDVEWTGPGSEPLTLVQGVVTCLLDVTRPVQEEE